MSEQIKKILTLNLILTHSDSKKDIIIVSDVSNLGLGAIILHKENNGQTKAIAHTLRTLLPAEKGYSHIEMEALGIIFAVKKFHRFVHGKSFTLQTDYWLLLSIFDSKKRIPVLTANRLERWGILLLNYDFIMEFLPSKRLGWFIYTNTKSM